MRDLRLYRQKRDPERTPEPFGGEAEPRPLPPAAPRHYVVQQHAARNLHWDLRLEIEGVLVSFAVPKGPSLDPAQKRLAVQTEDHPLEYGQFEGRIPDDEYGGGDSLIWDRGTWDTDPPGEAEAQRRRGRMSFVLDGEKLKGRFHMVRTRGQEGGKASWLLFKAKDEQARPGFDVVGARAESVRSGRRLTRGPVSAKDQAAPHPEPIRLLLAIWPPGRAPAGPGRVVRGERALAALSGGRVALQSGEGRDLAARHPKVARALAAIVVPEAILDGILTRAGRYVAADLLWLDGEDLRSRPGEERRDLLESVLSNVPAPLALAPRARRRRSAGAAAGRAGRRTGRRAA